jgi:DNA helicase TIP49 (TBP-interacting protein)
LDGLVVELVGRAGVGKTTIARSCEARLRGPGVPVFTVLGWSIPAWKRLQPRSVAAALRLAVTLRVPRSRRAVGLAVALYKELAKISYAQAVPGVVVFDQGLFQKLDSQRRLCPPLDGRDAGS